MAGGWDLITNDDGTPYNDHYGMNDMLETNGDMNETLAQCYGMVWNLAHWLAPADASRDDVLALIAKAEEKWQQGYAIGSRDGTPW